MTERNPTPANAALVAIDMSKHRQEVLIERPEGGRRRRMTVMCRFRGKPPPCSEK